MATVIQRLKVLYCSSPERRRLPRSRTFRAPQALPAGTLIHDRTRPYRLSARFVETIREPGCYGDGRGSGGLSLRVRRIARGQLSKSWRQRITVDGRPRNLGLGTWPHVSLAAARQKCVLNLVARQRGELVTGRRRTVPTFEEAVEKVIAVHRDGWKGGGRQENTRTRCPAAA